MNNRALQITPEFKVSHSKPILAFGCCILILVFTYSIESLLLSDASALNSTEHLSSLSLKSGIALTLLYTFGIVALPAIFIFPLIATLSTSLFDITAQLVVFSSIQGITLALQSLVIHRSFQLSVKTGNPLSNSKNLIVFIAQCTLIALLSSLLMHINEKSFSTLNIDQQPPFVNAAIINLISLMVIPTLFFAWRNHSNRIRQNTHPLEWFVWLSSGILSLYFSNYSHFGFILLIIPILMWASTRFNQLACCTAIFVSVFLILGASNLNNLSTNIYQLPSYSFSAACLLVVLTSLYFSTLRADHIKIEARLEDIVQQRTQDLLGANQELRDEVFIRKQTEQSLLNTSQRYKALFETAGIPIIVLDQTFKIKQWNTAAEIQFSYIKEEVLGKSFIDILIPESTRDETAWKFTKVLESGMSKENMESEVINHDGFIHTMLWNMSHLSDFDNNTATNTQNQLLLIGQNISDIRKTQDQLHYLAHFDPLTDTANRRLFEDRCDQAIQSAIRHRSEIALIGLDIDHFKRINDTLGHDIGDQFLVILASRLKTSVRKEDTIARLGGDEFAILLANVSGREGAETVARNILENITEPVTIKGNELLVTSSIGITICPNDGVQYPDLLKNADMAMYRAKKAGRNNIQFYSPEMNNSMQRQLKIEKELRTAFIESQFKLFYQPIIDIETGEVLALEALLRWNHPEKGIIAPDYFLEVAEQTGQLNDIGQWVIKNACLQGHAIQSWSEKPIQIALNVSNRQFNHPSLVKLVSQVISETKFNPQNLILEMAESTITDNMDTALVTLDQLNQLGVSLTIDSFGTGLSSLRQLKQIPIDIIKIDRSFVSGIPHDESDMAITETLLAIASQMDLKTFATGIETKDQEAFLKINGCRYGQGYLYAPPIPFKQLPALFEKINAGENLSQGDQIFLPFDIVEKSANNG
jgi:diguanylate cyclase (GGDEF)-like protein/PAS domain S-box-containing protein